MVPYRSEIVYIVQENQGISGARNAGIRIARRCSSRSWTATMFLSRAYLEVQTEIFKAHPDVDVVFPDSVYFGDSAWSGRTLMKMLPSSAKATFRTIVQGKCIVSLPSTVRRESLVRAGLFDPELHSAEDLDLWLRMARRGTTFLRNPKALHRYRIRADSVSADQAALISARIRVYQKLLDRFELPEDDRQCLRVELRKLNAELDLTYAKRATYAGRRGEALDCFTRANRVLHRWRVRLAIIMLRLCPKLLYAYLHHRYPAERLYIR